MSIWSSIDCERPGVKATTEVGSDVEIDVATATSWNSSVRLWIADTQGAGLDVGMLLTLDQAEVLIDRVTEAVTKIRDRKALCANDEETSR